MSAQTQTFSRGEHRRLATEWRAVDRSIPLHRVRELMERLAASTDPEHIAWMTWWRSGQVYLASIDGDAMTFRRTRTTRQRPGLKGSTLTEEVQGLVASADPRHAHVLARARKGELFLTATHGDSLIFTSSDSDELTIVPRAPRR